MNAALKKFQKDLKAYRKKHPNVSFKSAQKSVSRSRKAAPVKKRTPVRKARKIGTVKVKKVARKKSATARPPKKSGVSVASHLAAARKGLELQLGNAAVRMYKATNARQRKKVMKTITSVKSRLRRLK